MTLIEQLVNFAPALCRLQDGTQLQYRRARSSDAGDAITHVLLHGIGSASGSWLEQLQQARQAGAAAGLPPAHVLAWDMPGYGASSALTIETPTAADYARRLWDWLDALDGAADGGPITLVGHSLGALIAASATTIAPRRVDKLVLLAPAPGYGAATAELRNKKLADRLAMLATLGPAAMARERGRAMLSLDASADQLALVEQAMAAIDPAAYTQAARMLANGDLLADLRLLATSPILVASGSADIITSPKFCHGLAGEIGVPYVSLGPVGHICPLQAAARVNALLGLAGESP